jgi:diguanylate cyclase (GGDEF)-like protein
MDLDSCSVLAVPIINRGTLRALLLLENRLIRGAFSTERLDGVMLIAGQLAVSLDNALVYASLERKVAERTHQLGQANQRLQLMSITDPLTGLANRRHLEDVLQAEWHRAQSTGKPLALAMVDIDHFKLYNDHYGHVAGDKCLHRVATQVRTHIREIDLAARYGGEEFAIVMPNTDTATALELAHHLHHAITAINEPHAVTAEHTLTVSIGVAAVTPTPDSRAETIIELADVELYRAKRAGRNRVKPSRDCHQIGGVGESC